MRGKGCETGVTLGPQSQADIKPKEHFTSYMTAQQAPRPLIQLHGYRKTENTTSRCSLSSVYIVKPRQAIWKPDHPSKHCGTNSVSSHKVAIKKTIYLFQSILQGSGGKPLQDNESYP